MKIRKIEIDGLTVFNTPTIIDFSGRNGIIAITGDNGSGKTTIIEAIPATLFGELPSKKPSTVWELIAKGRKSAKTAIEFDYLDNTYRIEREFTVKNNTQKGKVSVLNGSTWEVVAGPLISAVNTWVNDNLFTFDIFTATSYAGQGVYNDITNIEPKERRELFIDMMGFRYLDQYSEFYKTHGKIIEADIAAKKAVIGSADVRVEDLGECQRIIDEHNTSIATSKTLIAQLNTELTAIKEQKDQAEQHRRKQTDKNEAVSFVIQKNDRLASLKESLRDINTVFSQKDDLEVINMLVGKQKTSLKAARNQLDELNREGAPQQLGLQIEKIKAQIDDSEKAKQTVNNAEEKLAAYGDVDEIGFVDIENERTTIRHDCVAIDNSLAIFAQHKTDFLKSIGDTQSRIDLLTYRKDAFEKQKNQNVPCNIDGQYQYPSCPLLKVDASFDIQELNTAETELKKLQQSLSDIEKQIDDTEHKKNRLLADLETVQSQIEKRSSSVESAKFYRQTIDTNLPKIVDVKPLRELIKQYETERQTARQLIESVNAEITSIKNTIEALETSDFVQKWNKLNGLLATNAKQNTERDIEEIEKEILQKQQIIVELDIELAQYAPIDEADIEHRYENLINQIDTNTKYIEQYLQTIGALENDIKRIKETLERNKQLELDIIASRKIADDDALLSFFFGRNGVQPILIDKILIPINKICENILSFIDGNRGAIQQVYLTTQVENHKGKTVETLDIMGTDEHGTVRRCSTFSGGELGILRNVPRIAILLYQAQQHSNRRINLFIGDEITANMDRENAIKMISLFKEMLEGQFDQVLLITHQHDTVAMMPNCLHVERVNGKTSLSWN